MYIKGEDQKQKIKSKPKIQEKHLKIDPSGLEIGKPREWVENSKSLFSDPFPG
jgi:hypothetical protein